VLSRLYGSEIDVVRLKGRIFVMSGSHDAERDEIRNDAEADTRDDPTGVRSGHA
jgi:hypothetical protein